ncbi:MAG: type I restriction-modification system subunit M N-terminal domain-containing protein [Fusobacteriaceae bacterium]
MAVNEKNSFQEERDEYTAENIFWVTKKGKWSEIVDSVKKSDVGTKIDDAMYTIEKENPALKNVLYKVYANSNLDKANLAKLGFDI